MLTLKSQLEGGIAHTLEGHETKIPEVTLGFWVIKIPATTLGETGGDSVTMTRSPTPAARVRRRTAGCCGAVLLDGCVVRAAVLDRIHSDTAAWCHARRFPRQALEPRRARLEPSHRLIGHRGHHGRTYSPHSTKRRRSSEDNCRESVGRGPQLLLL